MAELKIPGECERTRTSLPNYLRGHVFWFKRRRIERHLVQCVMCRSEYEAAKHVDDTRRLLKDLDLSEGMLDRVKDGVSTINRVRTIFYRPLWLAGLAALIAAIVYMVHRPPQVALEIEKLEKANPSVMTQPVMTTVTASSPTPTAPPATVRPGGRK